MDFAKEVRVWTEKFLKRYGIALKGTIKQPWDVLKVLDKVEVAERIEGQVEAGVKWDVPIVLGKGSVVKFPSRIEGPVIIGENVTVGPFAFIRGPCIIGDGCKVGSSEVKHAVLMDESCASHFAYVGDSVLGKRVNLGAGVKLANLRLDGEIIKVDKGDKKSSSGLRKLGAILEHDAQVGCNAVLNPGTYVRKKGAVLPGESVSGLIE